MNQQPINTPPQNGKGYLIMNVFTASGALPISGADVTVIGSSEEGAPAYNRKSDANGRTEVLELPTVSASLSQSPDNSFPYTTYNITITAPGYYTSTALKVPVFDGVTSIQPVAMIPLPPYQQGETIPHGNLNTRETP